MPSHGVAYKEAPNRSPEVLEMDERLWDHIHAARSFVQQRETSRSAPSAVVVRPSEGEAVIIVLMDWEPEVLPEAGELCHRFNLTPREAEVGLLLADRMSCREIAERLNMSFHTARCHTERILAKLEVKSKHDVRRRLLAVKSHLRTRVAE